MATVYQTDLEQARQRLSEGLARLREQASQVEALTREGKPTESARDLLNAIQTTIHDLEIQVRFLAETEGRQD